MDEAKNMQTKDEMEKVWEGEPIKKLIAQVDAGMKRLEHDKSVFKDKDCCDLLFKMINNSGILPEAIKMWCHKPQSEKNVDQNEKTLHKRIYLRRKIRFKQTERLCSYGRSQPSNDERTTEKHGDGT